MINNSNHRYTILESIKINSDTKTFLCKDSVLGLKRILKEIPKKNKNTYGDFSTLKNLTQEGLPLVFDAYEDDLNAYIILEYVNGVNLYDYLEKKKTLTSNEIIDIAIKISNTLFYLHTQKPSSIIHGDIKPENIIFNNNRVCVIDFSCVSSESGTSVYIAPERIIGTKKNIKSDIYGFGAVLYFICTGNIMKMYNNTEKESIKNEFLEIIEKCTKKNPKDRYENFGIILRELKRISYDEENVVIKNSTKLITICGNGMFALEWASVLSKSLKQKILLIDSNIFNPTLDIYLKNKKNNSFLQDIEQKIENLIVKDSTNKKLDYIFCRANLETYETFSFNSIKRIIEVKENDYDIILINTCDFIYDAICLKSIFFSDQVIFSIMNGLSDIRKYNMIIDFLYKRQNLVKEKFNIVLFDLFRNELRETIVKNSTEGKYLNRVSYSKKRNSMYSTGASYNIHMEKKIIKQYVKLSKKLNLGGIN